MQNSVCVEVPKDVAWQAMSRIDEVNLWVEMIARSYCISGHNRGLDTVRECVLTNNDTVQEKFTHWDEGNAFTYELTGPAIRGIKWAQNAWSLEAAGGKTLIRSVATIELKWGLLGQALGPFAWFIFSRDMANTMASLKYFVENGRPFEGRSSTLPRVSAVC